MWPFKDYKALNKRIDLLEGWLITNTKLQKEALDHFQECLTKRRQVIEDCSKRDQVVYNSAYVGAKTAALGIVNLMVEDMKKGVLKDIAENKKMIEAIKRLVVKE
jgi:hypothetical protein